jgi:hypothetical protein
VVAAIVLTAAWVSNATAQPTGDTAKYQPVILDLRACIRANAPPAHIAGVRSMADALAYFQERCFAAFSSGLAKHGAGDAASGGFRLIASDEWDAFRRHVGFY